MRTEKGRSKLQRRRRFFSLSKALLGALTLIGIGLASPRVWAVEPLTIVDLAKEADTPAGAAMAGWLTRKAGRWDVKFGDPAYFLIQGGALHLVARPGPAAGSVLLWKLLKREDKVIVRVTPSDFRVHPAERRHLEVTMAPLRLPGKGGRGWNGGPDGDLYLDIEVVAHPLYRVSGQDLYVDLPLAPWEAVLGASVAAAVVLADLGGDTTDVLVEPIDLDDTDPDPDPYDVPAATDSADPRDDAQPAPDDLQPADPDAQIAMVEPDEPEYRTAGDDLPIGMLDPNTGAAVGGDTPPADPPATTTKPDKPDAPPRFNKALAVGFVFLLMAFARGD